MKARTKERIYTVVGLVAAVAACVSLILIATSQPAPPPPLMSPLRGALEAQRRCGAKGYHVTHLELTVGGYAILCERNGGTK